MKSAVLLLAFGLASGVAWAAPASVPVAGPSETEETHAALKAAFAQAYLRYPRLPQGALEAQAFVASRWQHRVPEAPYAGRHGMPQSYGVMGLYRGQPGFADQVGVAAKLLGLSPERVARDLHSNVLGAAALLDSALGERSKVGRIEDISEALQNLSGILPAQASATAYARASHAFDLLLTLCTGATGVNLAMAVNDSDGTERSSARSLPANQWTYVEWKLDDSAQWSAWVGGNGVISSSQATLDAIWIYRAQSSYTVHLYIDDVQYRFEG